MLCKKDLFALIVFTITRMKILENQFGISTTLLTEEQNRNDSQWHSVFLQMKMSEMFSFFNSEKIFLLKIYAAKTQKTDPPLLDVGDCFRNEFFRGKFRTLRDSCRHQEIKIRVPYLPERRRTGERTSERACVCVIWEGFHEESELSFSSAGKNEFMNNSEFIVDASRPIECRRAHNWMIDS